MKETIVPAEKAVSEKFGPGMMDRIAERLFFSTLKRLKKGRIHIRDENRNLSFGYSTDEIPLESVVTVYHPGFYSRVVFGGGVGAGEAYILGYWKADDLTRLIRIVLLNPEVFEGIDTGWARVSAPLHKIFHVMHRDTRKGSRINIAAHYDLGNDFYKNFLDETLTYSCGIFESDTSTLKEASLAKYDRICRKLAIKASDHVLEIGTGWGGFALYAAENYGCRITTATISKRQYDAAITRVEEAGLSDRVSVLFSDYRDMKGKFDKLVSIEMIEAVGHQYLNTFFKVCSDRLKDDGMMMLQAITITDRVFDRHKRSVDFIKRYIFPGSCIPSITAVSDALARFTDLKMDHLEDITPHYARTLRTWRSRFFDNLKGIKTLGFSDRFIRMWEYYLCYCEAGFAERYLGDVQIRLIKPLCRPTPVLGTISNDR